MFFGHYHSVAIKIIGDIYDSNIFMFTLYSNGRCKVKKYERKTEVCTTIYNDEMYYRCGGGSCIRFVVGDIGNYGNEMKDMSQLFEGLKTTDLIGRDDMNKEIHFIVRRITVIEMN